MLGKITITHPSVCREINSLEIKNRLKFQLLLLLTQMDIHIFQRKMKSKHLKRFSSFRRTNDNFIKKIRF